MKRLLRRQKGQALVELALVFFLFVLFLLGSLQLVMLGSAQLRCQIAARRAAWVIGTYNHLDFDPHQAEIASLVPGFEVEQITGNREQEGKTILLSCQVPAIGFFRLLKPEGYKIIATSAVIAYTETPMAAQWIKKGVRSAMELFNRLK